MHSLHTRQSERDNHVLFSSCSLQRFRISSDRFEIMCIRNLCREAGGLSMISQKPGGQNFCHPIFFYVLYNSRAGIFPYQSKLPKE